MKRILLAVVIVSNLMNFAFAQKKTTILGDAVIGDVVATSDTAREITIRYVDKVATETFVGMVVERYKVKMKDGSLRELRISEITPGTRIRVFYKTKQEEVGGRKRKVHRIFRIDFLGKDEYARLRETLNLDPSAPIERAESDSLPAISPLKVYLASEYSYIKERLVDWMSNWNRKQGDKYGKLELVSSLSQADVSVVISRGSDSMVATIPSELYYAGNVIKYESSQATSYVVIKSNEGLKVLWSQVVPVLTTEKVEVSNGSIERELGKRMKARAQVPKK